MAKRAQAHALFIAAGLLAGTVSGIAYASYRRDIRQARMRVCEGSEIAHTACGPIEYGTRGDGPPVLVVHGAGGGFDQGLEAAGSLAESGFRLIAMSRFGYLRTPLPADASEFAQADAHACLLDALDIDRAAIIGASAGAPSTIQFALRHPDRCQAMVLLVPAAYVPREDGAASVEMPAGAAFLLRSALQSDFLFWLAVHLARLPMTEVVLATPRAALDSASAEERFRIQSMLEHVLPVSWRRRGLLNDAAVVASLRPYELERVAAPTLIISLADDLFGTFAIARYTAERIPGARFKSYAMGGHLWVGRHHELIAEIAAFLSAAVTREAVP